MSGGIGHAASRSKSILVEDQHTGTEINRTGNRERLPLAAVRSAGFIFSLRYCGYGRWKAAAPIVGMSPVQPSA